MVIHAAKLRTASRWRMCRLCRKQRLALSDIANYESHLIDEEVTEHAAMGSTRKLSFSSGRRCVRAAQDAIALARFPVGRAGKEPIWPERLCW